MLRTNTSKPLRFTPIFLIIPVIVAALAYASYDQMLWKMHLKAPMYPAGLYMQAYGTKITGDLHEINLLNHYVGMHPITEDSIELMWLYPFGVATLVLVGVLAAFLPRWRKWLALGALAVPLSMLATIQYYLWYFGHNLDPAAPIDLPPFTPLVLGKSTIVNFQSFSVPGPAMAFYLAAALVIWFGPTLLNRLRPETVTSPKTTPTLHRKPKIAVGVILMLFSLAPWRSATAGESPGDLQAQINAARPGDTLRIAGGRYGGPITIAKPITLLGTDDAVIDGNRSGSVVTINANNVTFAGFRVRRSGFEIHDDAAGISLSGDNVVVRNNRVEDVYFGIHAHQAGRIYILDNDIEPGLTYTSRPGHAVNVWNVRSATIQHNRLKNARDGILLTYVDEVLVEHNYVTRCRYGLHSMYSKNIVFASNTLEDNLLGIALMYSEKMTARNNTITEHRRGSSPYGFLLKDLDNLIMEGNRIIANQIGIFADAVSLRNNSESHIRNNVIAGNEVAVSLQSNVTLKFYGNSVVDNMVDFEKQGYRLNQASQWSMNDRGNYWSNYRGYDTDENGIGELPYRVEDLTEKVIDRSSSARVFLYTPSHLMLDAAIRMFPIFRPEPLLVDKAPVTEAPMIGVIAKEFGLAHASIALTLGVLWVLLAVRLVTWHPLRFRKPVLLRN